jgi:hypothetical protein
MVTKISQKTRGMKEDKIIIMKLKKWKALSTCKSK